MMVSFDPERYRRRMEESRRRLSAARALQEPDRVPITISTGGSFYCKLFGVNLRDYYQDAFGTLDLQLEVQLRGLKWAFEELGDDRTGCSVHVDLGPIQEALLFDLPVEYPDDTSPWAVRTMSVPEALRELGLIDPNANFRVHQVYHQYERLKEKVAKLGLKVGVSGGFQIHPPLSAACGILDVEEVLTCLHDEPAVIHRIFERLFLAFCRLKDYHDSYFRTQTTSIGLADDHSAFISDTMYRRHVMPYNMLIYARYGSRGRHLHADGPNDHHFQTYADIVQLTSMDIGGFSDIANAKPIYAGRLFFSGGLNCKDLYGDFDSARPTVDRALRIGMPGGGYALAVGGETYAGVNPGTLCHVVAYAREAGKYGARREEFAVL